MDQTIRKAAPDDIAAIHTVINDAAQAYRGVIPQHCWHEPYISIDELTDEIADGVEFSLLCQGDTVRAVMGIQQRRDVQLIRHAYVASAFQGQGFGDTLLSHLCARQHKPVLIGTWQAARWAIDFYCRRGFSLVERAIAAALLERYWRVPQTQIETSVVLADRRACEFIANDRTLKPGPGGDVKLTVTLDGLTSGISR